MTTIASQGVEVFAAGHAYPIGPATALGRRNHHIPDAGMTAAQLLHHAARTAGAQLDGQRWDPGLH
eukprot:10165689-Lingulodinium_polyedra.AAC.1